MPYHKSEEHTNMLQKLGIKGVLSIKIQPIKQAWAPSLHGWGPGWELSLQRRERVRRACLERDGP